MLERDETSSLNWRKFRPRLSLSGLLWTIMLSVTIIKLMVNGNIPCGVHPSITKVIKSGGGVLNSSSSSSDVYSSSEDVSLLLLPEVTMTSSLHQHAFIDRSSSASTTQLSVCSPSSTFPSRMQILSSFAVQDSSNLLRCSRNLDIWSIMADWVPSTVLILLLEWSHLWFKADKSSSIWRLVAYAEATCSLKADSGELCLTLSISSYKWNISLVL